MLFKNIYKGKKRISCISYLKKYLISNCFEEKIDILGESKKNFIMYYRAGKFNIKNNTKKTNFIFIKRIFKFHFK